VPLRLLDHLLEKLLVVFWQLKMQREYPLGAEKTTGQEMDMDLEVPALVRDQQHRELGRIDIPTGVRTTVTAEAQRQVLVPIQFRRFRILILPTVLQNRQQAASPALILLVVAIQAIQMILGQAKGLRSELWGVGQVTVGLK